MRMRMLAADDLDPGSQYLEEKVVELTRKQDSLGHQIKVGACFLFAWLTFTNVHRREDVFIAGTVCVLNPCEWLCGQNKERRIEMIAKEKIQ